MSTQSIDRILPKYPHSAIICGSTECGKTVFALDLLESHYKQSFSYIIILCPTVIWNKSYQGCSWIWTDPDVFVIDPGERLNDWLRLLYDCFTSEPTLYIIDDCSGEKALMKKRDMLSKLAFSGCHAEQSVWVLTQKYNAVLKDLREQVKWVAHFYCKDRHSFEDCLYENDVIPSSENKAALKEQLAKRKHAKLLLKTDPPTAFQVL